MEEVLKKNFAKEVLKKSFAKVVLKKKLCNMTKIFAKEVLKV